MRFQPLSILPLLLCCAFHQSMAADAPVEIPAAGWNADVIYENSSSPFVKFFDLGGAAWFETGSGGRMDGFPTNLRCGEPIKSCSMGRSSPFDRHKLPVAVDECCQPDIRVLSSTPDRMRDRMKFK